MAATTFKWAVAEALTAYLSTELNSLADGAFSAAGAAIDNTVGLYELIVFEVVLAALSPAAGAFVDVWAEYAPDGTNYTDHAKPLQTTGVKDAGQLDTTAATAQRILIGPCLILPYKAKFSLRNKAGVALAGSGNTLKYSRIYEQGV